MRIRWEALGSLILAMIILVSVFYIVEGVNVRLGVDEKSKALDIDEFAAYSVDWDYGDMLARNHIQSVANRTLLTDGVIFTVEDFQTVQLSSELYLTKIWIDTNLSYYDVYNKAITSISFHISFPYAVRMLSARLEVSANFTDVGCEPSNAEPLGENITNVSVSLSFNSEYVLKAIAYAEDSTVAVELEVCHTDPTLQFFTLRNATYTYQVRIVPSGFMFGVVGVVLILIAIYSTEIVSVKGTMDAIDRLKSRRRRR